MIVELWANKIISGEKTFAEVPRLLKEKVKACLIKKGRLDLTISKGVI